MSRWQTHFSLLTDNARYKKLLFERRKEQRGVFYRGIRKVVSLSTSSRISREIIRNIASAKQCIEEFAVKFPCMGRDQSTVITQDYVLKIISNINGMPDVISRFAVFSYRNLPRVKSVFFDFFGTGTCRHKSFSHFISDGPVVVDVSIIAKPNWHFTRHGLFVNAADMDIGNITQSNFIQEMILP